MKARPRALYSVDPPNEVPNMVDSKCESARPCGSPDDPAALLGGFVPCGAREAGSRWYVLVTAYQAEAAVERTVRSLGLPTWLGQYEDANHRIKLMFPRYLLFQADLASDDRWRDLYTKPGVDMVLGTRGERPTPLPAAPIAALFASCGADGVIYQPREPVLVPTSITEDCEVEMAAG